MTLVFKVDNKCISKLHIRVSSMGQLSRKCVPYLCVMCDFEWYCCPDFEWYCFDQHISTYIHSNARAHTHTHTHTHVSCLTYQHTRICVCVDHHTLVHAHAYRMSTHKPSGVQGLSIHNGGCVYYGYGVDVYTVILWCVCECMCVCVCFCDVILWLCNEYMCVMGTCIYTVHVYILLYCGCVVSTCVY